MWVLEPETRMALVEQTILESFGCLHFVLQTHYNHCNRQVVLGFPQVSFWSSDAFVVQPQANGKLACRCWITC